MSVQSTLQQFNPAGKFLLLIGLFLVSLAAASVSQVLIILPFTDLKSMGNLDFTNPGIVQAMKVAQAASAILAFIAPSLLFAYLTLPIPPKGRESERTIPALSGRLDGAFSYLRLNKGFNVTLGLAAMMLVFTAMPLINWMGELNSHLSLPSFMSGMENWMKSSEASAKKIIDAFLQMNSIGDLITNLILIALLAALGEELFFRGAMQNVFLEWTKNKHTAVWMTAILFSAFHAQFYGFIPRMLLGVVLGYLYVWSGSLWLSMFFHFLNNGLAVLFTYLIGKGEISKTAETVGAGDTPIYFVVLSAVMSVGLMYLVYKNRCHSSPSLPEGESA